MVLTGAMVTKGKLYCREINYKGTCNRWMFIVDVNVTSSLSLAEEQNCDSASFHSVDEELLILYI